MMHRMTIRNNPDVINALVHNLSYVDDDNNIVTIASDAAINERILTKFKYYDYLYTIDEANASILQDIINSWRYKVIELYKTTLYEYNPIWNVDGSETREVTTVYGHKIQRQAGTTEATTDTTKIVNSQTTDAEASTTYGRKDTTSYGRKDTTSYGRKDTTSYGATSTDAQTVGATRSRNDYGYDSNTAAPSFSEASNDGTHTTTKGGTDNTQLSGSDDVQLSGSDNTQLSGTDSSTYNAGTTQSQHSGGISTTHSGSDNDTHSGTDKVTDVLTRGGNIGVTSTQSLIQQERDIIIDVVEFYVEQFAEAFNINPLIFLNKYAEQEDF